MIMHLRDSIFIILLILQFVPDWLFGQQQNSILFQPVMKFHLSEIAEKSGSRKIDTLKTSSETEEKNTGERPYGQVLLHQSVGSVLGGICGGIAGYAICYYSLDSQKRHPEGDGYIYPFLSGSVGYILGAAATTHVSGRTKIHKGSFWANLAGSTIGFVPGLILSIKKDMIWPIFISTSIGSITGDFLSRKRIKKK